MLHPRYLPISDPWISLPIQFATVRCPVRFRRNLDIFHLSRQLYYFVSLGLFVSPEIFDSRIMGISYITIYIRLSDFLRQISTLPIYLFYINYIRSPPSSTSSFTSSIQISISLFKCFHRVLTVTRSTPLPPFSTRPCSFPR